MSQLFRLQAWRKTKWLKNPQIVFYSVSRTPVQKASLTHVYRRPRKTHRAHSGSQTQTASVTCTFFLRISHRHWAQSIFFVLTGTENKIYFSRKRSVWEIGWYDSDFSLQLHHLARPNCTTSFSCWTREKDSDWARNSQLAFQIVTKTRRKGSAQRSSSLDRLWAIREMSVALLQVLLKIWLKATHRALCVIWVILRMPKKGPPGPTKRPNWYQEGLWKWRKTDRAIRKKHKELVV